VGACLPRRRDADARRDRADTDGTSHTIHDGGSAPGRRTARSRTDIPPGRRARQGNRPTSVATGDRADARIDVGAHLACADIDPHDQLIRHLEPHLHSATQLAGSDLAHLRPLGAGLGDTQQLHDRGRRRLLTALCHLSGVHCEEHPVTMTQDDEALALEHVCEALAARFPTVDEQTVRSVVDEAYAVLDGPVRDYVPLLVERRSRERLAGLTRLSRRSAAGAQSRGPLLRQDG
jgi:hypothetical protein